jgi:outer membrane receptor protein involved in Fe transport
MRTFRSVLCFILMMPTIACAQQMKQDSLVQKPLEFPPVQLQEVTVIGVPAQREVPVSTISVSPVDLQRTPSTDAWDLLRQTAGIEVHEQGQGPGFASDASIRGFSSDHSTDIALWVDGVPVNEPVNGHAEGYDDLSLLFPQLIKSIEVTKGPVSPLFGNFDIAGAINIRTLERVDKTSGWLSGGSNGHAEGTLVTGFDGDKAGGVLGVRGVRDGGWRPNSAWQLGQVYGRFARDFSEKLTIDGGVELYGSSWDSPGFLTADQFDRRQYDIVTNETDGGFKRRAQERVSFRVFATPSTLWRSTFYSTQGRWQLYLTIPPEPGAGEGSGSQTEEEDSRHSLGGTSAVSWSNPWGEITLGVEGGIVHADYQNWFTTARRRDSVQTLVSARQLSGALFVQSDIRIGDRIHLSIGGRYDDLGTESTPDGEPSVKESKGTFSPKVGASMQLLPLLNIYANVSRGFRQTDGVISDPALPFIIAWNYEAGLKFGSEALSANAAFFRMDVSNEQTFNPVTLTSTSNGASRRRGVDISLKAEVTDAVSLASSFTYTDGEYLDRVAEDGADLSGSPIFNTAKYVGTFAVDVVPPGQIWGFRIGSNLVGPYAPFDEPGVTLPAYALVHASAELRLKKFLVEFGVHNLFDQAYAELRAGGFVNPGQPTSAYGTVKYVF